MPGFNLGTAALEGSKLYVSTIGFVGRFDVESWDYDWTHGNLYERHRFNGFAAPVVHRERVVFPEVRSDAGKESRHGMVGMDGAGADDEERVHGVRGRQKAPRARQRRGRPEDLRPLPRGIR
jgi:hypothetical protein